MSENEKNSNEETQEDVMFDLTPEQQKSEQKRRSVAKTTRVVAAKTIGNSDSFLAGMLGGIITGSAVFFSMGLEKFGVDTKFAIIYFLLSGFGVVMFFIMLAIKNRMEPGEWTEKIKKHESIFKTGDGASLVGNILYFLSTYSAYNSNVYEAVIFGLAGIYVHYSKTALPHGKFTEWSKLPPDEMVEVASRSIIGSKKK